jgi:DNA-binding transcriptional regulator LsrR (DeoR family)
VKTRIVASGGPEKLPVIRAVLRAGYATVLITDERTAARLADTADRCGSR